MRLAYFDCFCGSAGDMILAALVHAGLDVTCLHDVVSSLGLRGVTIHVSQVQRKGIAARHVRVDVAPEARRKHRHLPQILEMIGNASLPPAVAQRARQVFERLAAAEAKVHGIVVDQVHFHEVGAADAIVDIVGACLGLHVLGIERVVCSPIPTGSGTVTCEHGVLPVPAPATAELLQGVPLAACDETGELTTPTGAAILTTLADAFGPLPAMSIQTVGYGAGTRENCTRPNLLRVLIGTDATSTDGDEQIVVLETNLDDVPGQTLAHATEQLLAAGALDVFTVPIQMKKGRPGHLLTVLATPDNVSRMEEILFAETATLGIRRRTCDRRALARNQVTVNTSFGDIRLKVGRSAGRVLHVRPEYDDCAAAARRAGVALRVVQDAALESWKSSYDRQSPGSPR